MHPFLNGTPNFGEFGQKGKWTTGKPGGPMISFRREDGQPRAQGIWSYVIAEPEASYSREPLVNIVAGTECRIAKGGADLAMMNYVRGGTTMFGYLRRVVDIALTIDAARYMEPQDYMKAVAREVQPWLEGMQPPTGIHEIINFGLNPTYFKLRWLTQHEFAGTDPKHLQSVTL